MLSLIVFLVAAVPIRADNDCFWQLKAGEYISKNGIPTNDVFSYTASDHEWHNHEWLTQVLMYQVYRIGDGTTLGGWRAVILAKTFVLWGSYAILYLLAGRLSKNWWIALLVAILAVAIGRRMFYPRPPVVSNLMLAAELYLLVAVGEGWLRRWWLALLVPAIALWTNLHGGWLAGGVVLAAWAVCQLWSRFREKLPLQLPFEAQPNTVPLVPLVVLGVLCLVATIANPFTYHLYELPARVMGDRNLVSQIFELQSPNFYYVIDFEFVVIGTIVLGLFSRNFRPRIFELLIWLFFVHQAIQHVRHLFLFSVMMVPLMSRLLANVAETASAQITVARREFVHVPALALALMVGWWVLLNPRETGTLTDPLAANTYPARFLSFYQGEDYIDSSFPTSVCNLIELAEPRGRMFNENSYAGYVIWRLVPEKYQVFTDPRFDIFGGEIWRTERLIAAGVILPDDGNSYDRPYFEVLLDRYDIQWVITRGESPLASRFADGITKTPWALGAHWRDPRSLMPWAGWQIWVRDIPENQTTLENFRISAPFEGAMAGT